MLCASSVFSVTRWWVLLLFITTETPGTTETAQRKTETRLLTDSLVSTPLSHETANKESIRAVALRPGACCSGTSPKPAVDRQFVLGEAVVVFKELLDYCFVFIGLD